MSDASRDRVLPNLEESKRLYWQCRRGLLELDLLLIPFLENVYSSLADLDKHSFSTLLACSDPEILSWLLGTKAPPISLEGVVQKIRVYAKTKHND